MCCSVANALKQMCELKTLSRASTFISSVFCCLSALIRLNSRRRENFPSVRSFSFALLPQWPRNAYRHSPFATHARTHYPHTQHTVFRPLHPRLHSTSNYMPNQICKIKELQPEFFTSVRSIECTRRSRRSI